MKKTIVLGLRYYGGNMKDYYKVKELTKKENVSLSEMGRILINRGLHYTENPVIVEKLVVKKVPKVVYKDRIIYKERPEPEHISSSVESKKSDALFSEHIEVGEHITSIKESKPEGEHIYLNDDSEGKHVNGEHIS